MGPTSIDRIRYDLTCLWGSLPYFYTYYPFSDSSGEEFANNIQSQLQDDNSELKQFIDDFGFQFFNEGMIHYNDELRQLVDAFGNAIPLDSVHKLPSFFIRTRTRTHFL